MNILVVCHGNINRSPLCAAVLAEGTSFSVRSAGFVNPGRRATLKMREQAAALGYDLERHRSQLITPHLLQNADLVVYMDGGNLKRLQVLPDFDMAKAVCLGASCVPPRERIADPNYMRRGSAALQEIASVIAQASQRLKEHLL